MKVPGLRSSYEKVGGIVFFGRMLDKIRLHAAGRLPSDYFVGTENRTYFDSRCTRFLRIDYKAVVARVLQGGSDEEILDWCFRNGHRPSDDEIEVWNEFMMKRGWNDPGSKDFQEAKRKRGFADREDIQTWFDLQNAEERDETVGN